MVTRQQLYRCVDPLLVGWRNIEENFNHMHIPFFQKKNTNDKNTYFAPRQSMVQIKGSLSSPSPAMTG
jgi:hypothetical protein